MKEAYRKWYTKYLSRDMEMLIFGHAGYPVILFPTAQGRYYQSKDNGLIEAAAPLLDAGLLKVYCPDGIDSESWYNNALHPADRVKTYNGYERMIVNDVIEFALADTGAPQAAAAGCGLGGYHAANIAFRHPELVGHLISMSGTYDIKQFIYGYYDDNCYFNNPMDYMPSLKDEYYLSRYRTMGIILGTGDADYCREENRRLSEILTSQKVNHWLDDRTGYGHDWFWWKKMLPEYLTHVKQ
ncbi:MAG: esterase family protein [Acidobacteriota bacterium]